MASTTRTQLLKTARDLFAERGFYGVSIAAIADQHGLTKQALLHYFPSKEKIYGAVLKEISWEIEEHAKHAVAASDDPKTQLKTLLQVLLPSSADDVVRTRLLMRELLDNKHRAETAGEWYLKPFLKTLIRLIKKNDGWSHASDAQALAVVYQLLGAVNYVAVSEPTLTGIFGASGVKAMTRAFPAQLEATTDAALRDPPPRR
ncbi:MAG: TetR/AcrR family transcriptional regulator [Pseudomonadota bacterium]